MLKNVVKLPTINALSFIASAFLLTSCGSSPKSYTAPNIQHAQKATQPSIEQSNNSYGTSEEVRIRLHAMPKYFETKLRALVYYKDPEKVSRNGYITGYLKACKQLTASEHNQIIRNQLEMIELSATDTSLYKNGVPNKAMIAAKKRVFNDGLQNGIKASRVIKREIRRTYCGEILRDFKKSIWDWGEA